MRSKPRIIAYTDGACQGNPGPGGWGVLLKYNDHEKEFYGYELNTTNNRMELTAAIKALRALKTPCLVEIYTDSKYLQQGITLWIHSWIKNNWYKSNNELVKNADLWQELYNELETHIITWKWVKGHSDNIGNIIADKLAVKGKNTAIRLLKCHS